MIFKFSSIFSMLCFTLFRNDKLLSLAAVIARYTSYTLRSTFYYSFSFVSAFFSVDAVFKRPSFRVPLYRHHHRVC